MDETDKEIIKHRIRCTCATIALIICAAGMAGALGSHMAEGLLKPLQSAFFIGFGSIGWFWLITVSLKELEYLTILKKMRGY